MSSKNLNKNLDQLEAEVAIYFNELLQEKKEIVIFEESDLEYDNPDDYLEVRNDITGNVFDVHPLKVTKDGILVIEADGSFTRHLIKLHDLASTQDKITLVGLMEDSL
jgi:hypothetical protein